MLAGADIFDAQLFPVEDKMGIVIIVALFTSRAILNDFDCIILETPAASLGGNV